MSLGVLSRWRNRTHGGLGPLRPGFEVWRVDAVRRARTGQQFVTLVQGDVLMSRDGDAQAFGESLQLGFDGAAERVGIAVVEDRFGPGVGDKPCQRVLGRARTDDETATDSREVLG